MTHEYARKRLETIVDIYRTPRAVIEVHLTGRDIQAIEVAISALKEQENEEDDRK